MLHQFKYCSYSTIEYCIRYNKKSNQSVQDYTTKFHKQAIFLEISINDHVIFMKYIGGLHKSIRKELKLFKVEDICEANMKAMGIEKKNQPMEDKKGKKHIKMTRKNIMITVTFVDI